MNKDFIYLYSQAKDLRLYVIEHTLLIEELISACLGLLLNIKWERSKSLGFNSTSLSFNQKLLLIQDKEDIDKEVSQKFEVLMQFRNKFAHVKSIDSFKSFFALSSGDAVKKKLDKWYSGIKCIENNFEKKYQFYFCILSIEILMILTEISKNYVYKMGLKDGEYEAMKDVFQMLKVELSKSKEGSEIWNSVLDRVTRKI